MEEIEVPLEKILEDTHHHAEHAGGGQAWLMQGALLSAILAVFAAISALLAGHYANEAMLEQLQSSDKWSYYQAKGIKSSVLEIKREVQTLLGKGVDPKVEEKLNQYKEDQQEISDQANEKEQESKAHMRQHQTLARSVTFFQIAIAITAIAVLVRKRRFLLVSILFGTIGIFFLVQGYFFV
jgi:hypothetical protein